MLAYFFTIGKGWFTFIGKKERATPCATRYPLAITEQNRRGWKYPEYAKGSGASVDLIHAPFNAMTDKQFDRLLHQGLTLRKQSDFIFPHP